MKGYSPSLVSTLFFGLPDNARTKMSLEGTKLTVEQTLLAMIVDGVNLLVWENTKDAAKGRNKPKSVLEILNGDDNEKDFETFATLDEFEKARMKILEEKE